MPRKQSKTPENADEPYDSVKIDKDADGKHCAIFYVAAEGINGPGTIIQHLDTLVIDQKNYRSEGWISPVTDMAIRQLRLAMNLPDLH